MRIIKRRLYGLLFILVSFTYVFYKSQAPNKQGFQPRHPNNKAREEVDNQLSDNDLITDIGLIRNEADIKKREKGYFNYALNVLISDRLDLDREIPDTCHEKCKDLQKDFSSLSKTASVVITFHNEATRTLLRTITSVLNRTPKELLHEIILFDDFSDLIDKETIQSFVVEHKPLIKIIHASKREGLIRGKLQGAKVASGDVLVFLDSHCEVNTNWLQPLLLRIENNRKTVACPVIDMINPNSFVYTPSVIVRGGFNWGMSFTWEEVPPNSDINPEYDTFISPTMAGGLFAMDRKYFFEIGGYDEGMEIWGGENLEISFRIWMCGGRLEIVPCSRVGHVFKSRISVGSKWAGSDSSNAVRVAEVWLDDYKKHFYALKPHLESKKPDVKERKALREKLICNSFTWYLNAIYPQIAIPGLRDSGFVSSEAAVKKKELTKEVKILHSSSLKCLDPFKHVAKAPIVLKDCNSLTLKSWFFYSNEEIRARGKLCLDVMLIKKNTKQVRLMKCHDQRSGQEWRFMDSQHLYNPSTGMCLGVSDNLVTMGICNKQSEDQKWKMQIEM